MLLTLHEGMAKRKESRFFSHRAWFVLSLAVAVAIKAVPQCCW